MASQKWFKDQFVVWSLKKLHINCHSLLVMGGKATILKQHKFETVCPSVLGVKLDI